MKPKSHLTLTGLTTSVIFLSLILSSAAARSKARYIVTDLGRLGARSDSWRDGAMAINDRGQVTGGYKDHTFLWSSGRRQDLGALSPAGPEAFALSVGYGINNRGEIAGSSGDFRPIAMSGLEFVRGFVTKNGRLHQITDQAASFVPYAVNDAGQVAGLNAYQGFFYTNGKLIPIGIFSNVTNGTRSLARSLNQQGQVVGWSTVRIHPKAKHSCLATHAFLWQRHGTSARMRDLGSLPRWDNSYAYGINRQGEIIGSVSDTDDDTDGIDRSSHAKAFLWRRGKMSCLGTLPGSKNSAAFGINDSTEIVGTSDARAFLWKQGKMLDLNACLPSGSGWALEEARAINNKGQIVGSGKLHGQAHMFLLTPTAPQ